LAEGDVHRLVDLRGRAIDARGPLGLRLDRSALVENEVAQQRSERLRRREVRPQIGRRERAPEKVIDSKPVQQALTNGSPPALHGPYYQWTHKVRGKTITKRLSKAQAKRCQQSILNHRQLKKLVRRMEALSLRATDREMREISES